MKKMNYKINSFYYNPLIMENILLIKFVELI